MMGYGVTSPYEITSDLMIKKMWLEDNERDMVVMQHLFLASYPDGKREVISSRMLDFGTPATNTSIATDGCPACSDGCQDDPHGQDKTVTAFTGPILPELYNPILDELDAEWHKDGRRVRPDS
ncbi:MAG: hypothetical protein MZV63_30465 [Marinilabiliales bacterium]|nr:hypothetical protein [Marinilabiliales bacterium]